MKIEFIKEEKFEKIIYYTNVNNSFMDGSLEFDEAKARAKYDFIVKNNGVLTIKTVIDSIEIEEAK